MDISKIEIKTAKTVYITLAVVLMIGAIASALLSLDYVALGFIVLASAVILAGSLFVRYLYDHRPIRDDD